jgi:TctA family transporter
VIDDRVEHGVEAVTRPECQQLRLALTIGLGDPAVLVANPASWAVIALTLLVLASPWLRRGRTVTS